MVKMARFAFLSLAALLAACSSRAPAPAPVVQPQVTYSQPSPSPIADDVLIRAIGLVGTPYRWGQYPGLRLRLQRPDQVCVP